MKINMEIEKKDGLIEKLFETLIERDASKGFYLFEDRDGNDFYVSYFPSCMKMRVSYYIQDLFNIESIYYTPENNSNFYGVFVKELTITIS